MSRYIYAIFFGQGRSRLEHLPAAVALAAVNTFEATERRPAHGDWAVYIGAVPQEDVPEHWSATDIADAVEATPSLDTVLAWGSKLPPEAGKALFPQVELLHPEVHWRE